MNIQLRYFGMLTEVTACDSEIFETSGGQIKELISELINKYPALKTKDFQVAQNQHIVGKDAMLSGEEVALLPPFSGG